MSGSRGPLSTAPTGPSPSTNRARSPPSYTAGTLRPAPRAASIRRRPTPMKKELSRTDRPFVLALANGSGVPSGPSPSRRGGLTQSRPRRKPVDMRAFGRERACIAAFNRDTSLPAARHKRHNSPGRSGRGWPRPRPPSIEARRNRLAAANQRIAGRKRRRRACALLEAPDVPVRAFPAGRYRGNSRRSTLPAISRRARTRSRKHVLLERAGQGGKRGRASRG